MRRRCAQDLNPGWEDGRRRQFHHGHIFPKRICTHNIEQNCVQPNRIRFQRNCRKQFEECKKHNNARFFQPIVSNSKMANGLTIANEDSYSKDIRQMIRVIDVCTINCYRPAVTQWIRLRLQSCGPGFESQAHHLCNNQFKFKL